MIASICATRRRWVITDSKEVQKSTLYCFVVRQAETPMPFQKVKYKFAPYSSFASVIKIDRYMCRIFGPFPKFCCPDGKFARQNVVMNWPCIIPFRLKFYVVIGACLSCWSLKTLISINYACCDTFMFWCHFYKNRKCQKADASAQRPWSRYSWKRNQNMNRLLARKSALLTISYFVKTCLKKSNQKGMASNQKGMVWSPVFLDQMLRQTPHKIWSQLPTYKMELWP